MFENLMRKKFYENKLFVETDNKIERVEKETTLLDVVKNIKWDTKFDYIDGTLTIKVAGAQC